MARRIVTKQMVNQWEILRNLSANEMVLPEEPLIYSIKYRVGQRVKSVQNFRNAKFASILKCCLKKQQKCPVVLFVKFFVPPHPRVELTPKQLRQENVPATDAYELCDYLLSFLECIHRNLINSYRQIVQLYCEKFYSDHPRTEFQFMPWSTYVEIYKAPDSNPAKSQAVVSPRPPGEVQSVVARNGAAEEIRPE